MSNTHSCGHPVDDHVVDRQGVVHFASCPGKTGLLGSPLPAEACPSCLKPWADGRNHVYEHVFIPSRTVGLVEIVDFLHGTGEVWVLKRCIGKAA